MIISNQEKKKEIAVQDYVSEFYENKRYSKPYSLAYHNWWARKTLSLVDLKSPILDNGCGNGFMARFLKGHEVTGLDISPGMVKLAKKRYSKVVLGDSQKLPFKDSSFQTVINRSILHHLPEPYRGVSEIHRVLKSGGQAVFAETLWSPISAVPRVLLKQGEHFSELHKNFKEKELRELIGSKLKIEKIEYLGYLGYFLLGFPDVFDLYKFFPAKQLLTPLFIKLDELISGIPFVNRQAWTIIILATKQ